MEAGGESDFGVAVWACNYCGGSGDSFPRVYNGTKVRQDHANPQKMGNKKTTYLTRVFAFLWKFFVTQSSLYLTCKALAKSVTMSLATVSVYLISEAIASKRSPPWRETVTLKKRILIRLMRIRIRIRHYETKLDPNPESVAQDDTKIAGDDIHIINHF